MATEINKREFLEETVEAAKEAVSEIFGEKFEEVEKRSAETMKKMQTDFMADMKRINNPNTAKDAQQFIEAALAAGKNGNTEKALKYIKGRYEKDSSYKGVVEAIEKTIGTTDLSSGGVFVNEDQSPNVIEYLQNKTIFDKMEGIIEVPVRGTWTIPKETNALSGSNIAEGGTVNEASPTTGALKLELKKVESVSAFYEESLQDNYIATSTWLSQKIRRDLAVKTDLDLLRGTGTANTVKGLRYLPNSSNIADIAATTSTISFVLAELKKCILALANKNIAFRNPYWIMAPRTAAHIQFLSDTGNYMFMNGVGVMGGTLIGMPAIVSNQVPITAGTGSSSEIYLVDASEILIGKGNGMELKMTDVGSYSNSSGTLTSTFAEGSIAMKATVRHDIALMQDYACAIRTAVGYGA